MDDDREPELRQLYRGESVPYCFNFANTPEVAAGWTLSSPSISILDGTAFVTFGSPAVLVAEFIEYDENGEVNRTVATGKGIEVSVTPGSSKGTSLTLCKAVATNPVGGATATVGVPVKFQVK